MLNANSKERIDNMEDEKSALQKLVDTLTGQNKEILDELETHMRTNENVRNALDRKGKVGRMLDTFNKDLIESKRQVEVSSPQRYMRPGQMYEETLNFGNGSNMSRR